MSAPQLNELERTPQSAYRSLMHPQTERCNTRRTVHETGYTLLAHVMGDDHCHEEGGAYFVGYIAAERSTRGTHIS